MTALIVVSAALCVGLVAWLALGWMRACLDAYRHAFTQTARVHLDAFFLFIDPGQLWAINLALCVAAAVLALLLTGSAVLTLVAAGMSALVPRLCLAHWRARRLARFDAQLPDALQALAAGLQAGVSLGSALRHVAAEAPAPLGQEFGLMLREQRLGVSLDVALAGLVRRMPSEATTLTVAAMRIAADTGGNLAEALERIATLVRARLHMQGRIEALTAQGRLQAWVVGALPPLLALVLDRLEPQAMAALWHTPAGWTTLAVIIALEVLGLWWVRRIVRIDI